MLPRQYIVNRLLLYILLYMYNDFNCKLIREHEFRRRVVLPVHSQVYIYIYTRTHLSHLYQCIVCVYLQNKRCTVSTKYMHNI
jgi:hypothetical protein